jgi:PAS domain S-box-containing protein
MLILTYFYSKLEILTKKFNKIINSIIIGICFGLFTVIVIKYPIIVTEGVFVDSRLVIISLSALFGSWIAALITVILSAGYRLYVDGIGTITGILMIIFEGISGIIFNLKKIQEIRNKYYILLIFGFVQSVISLSFLFLLPFEIAMNIFKTFALPSFIYHPLVIIFLGGFLYHEIEYIIMQQKIKETEERYKRLVEKAPGILYIYSLKNGGVYYSDKVKKILGYSKEYLCKNPFLWKQSIHPDDKEKIKSAFNNIKKGTNFEVEYRLKHKSGRWVWLLDKAIDRREINNEIFIE